MEAILHNDPGTVMDPASRKKDAPGKTPPKTPGPCEPLKKKRNCSAIKLKDYNGSTSIETFLKQFHTCAAYCQWTEEDKGVYPHCQLTGDVVSSRGWPELAQNEIFYMNKNGKN